MAIRYSFDDFTTKGHGVIEGEHYFSYKYKSDKKKNTKGKSKDKDTAEDTYNHLLTIKNRADAERRAQEYNKQYPLNQKDKK